MSACQGFLSKNKVTAADARPIINPASIRASHCSTWCSSWGIHLCFPNEINPPWQRVVPFHRLYHVRAGHECSFSSAQMPSAQNRSRPQSTRNTNATRMETRSACHVQIKVSHQRLGLPSIAPSSITGSGISLPNILAAIRSCKLSSVSPFILLKRHDLATLSSLFPRVFFILSMLSLN